MRARRTASVATALALVTLLALTAAGCGSEDDAPAAAGAWRTLPEAPLSPRDQAVVVGVGDQVLVVGGWEYLCPPGADCAFPGGPLLDDGAVYDRSTDAWRAVSPPPFGVRRDGYTSAAVGGTAYLLTGCARGPECRGAPHLLSYDLAADRWTDRGRLPGPASYRQLTAVGDDLVATSQSDEHGEVPDLRYDPRHASWSELPDDPLPRTFDRFVVPVGDQLVLAGSSIAAVNAGTSLPKQAARYDLDTGTWTRLPDAPGQGYQLLPSDDGPVLNGHFGDAAGWVLDPGTWTWSALPGGDGEHTNWSGVVDRHGATYDVANSVGQVASDHLDVYDSTADAFVTIPPPPGREDVYDDSSTALGRDLFVFGGQRWPGGAEADGELVTDARLWTPPGG